MFVCIVITITIIIIITTTTIKDAALNLPSLDLEASACLLKPLLMWAKSRLAPMMGSCYLPTAHEMALPDLWTYPIKLIRTAIARRDGPCATGEMYHMQGSFCVCAQPKRDDVTVILCMRPAKVRRRYKVTSSLFGWAYTQNDPCTCPHKGEFLWRYCVGIKHELLPSISNKYCILRSVAFVIWMITSRWFVKEREKLVKYVLAESGGSLIETAWLYMRR